MFAAQNCQLAVLDLRGNWISDEMATALRDINMSTKHEKVDNRHLLL